MCKKEKYEDRIVLKIENEKRRYQKGDFKNGKDSQL